MRRHGGLRVTLAPVPDLHDAVRAFVADTVLPQVEAWDRAASSVDVRADDARELSIAAKILASDTAV